MRVRRSAWLVLLLSLSASPVLAQPARIARVADDGTLAFVAAAKPRLPDHVYQTLKDICAAYPWSVVQSDEHLGELLNAVAWRHRAEGWGLSRKTGGRHVDSPAGPIAEDILQTQDGHHYDVLGSAARGNPLRPWQAESIGIIDLRARPWVAPVEHRLSWEPDSGTPTPTDPITIDPTTPVDYRPVLNDISQRLAIIDARLTAIESREPAGDFGALAAYIDDMVGAGPAGDPALMPNHVTDVKTRLDVIRVQLEQLNAWLRSRSVFRF
jgi:hypothetical protein